ncbi:uncharacterized protein LOC116134101 [Pistacia vera]|uniref:uncharacterized protein LOC116134101 n=1 Tax=Pistacia vera TaxID=55513 RepID=UPI001262FE63|nr:uncharacterized protein LOC116134101 [Pistacia vera]
MSEKNTKKRILICLSEEENDDDNDDEDEDSSVSSFSEYESDEVTEDDYQSDQDGDDEDEDDGDDESLCNRVIFLVKGGGDLGALNVKACIAYLRKHGLRISGTKTVCIQRIKEHWRINDGDGEALYPKSSFSINCTGDVCKGDVVLFTQKVYEKFDKVTRHGRLLGKRTIAGRVVNESYGVAKQQHTFTIEILWIKGINRLPTLFPLLVKGRNLYKLKTFRQLWNDEEERVKVLAEKHKRGAVARFVRAIRKTKTWSTNAGAKRQKYFHHTRSSQMSKTTKPEKRRCLDGPGKAMPLQHAKLNNHRKDAPPRNPKFKQNLRSGGSQLCQRHQNFHRRISEGPNLRSFTPPQGPYLSQIEFHHNNSAFHFCGHDVDYSSTMTRIPHIKPFSYMSMMPTTRNQGYNHSNCTHHAFSSPSHSFEPRDLNCFPGLRTVDRHSHQCPSRTEAYGPRKNGFQYVFR